VPSPRPPRALQLPPRGSRALARRGVAAACAGLLAGCAAESDGVLRATGTLEARETAVAPLAPARLLELRVQEGDTVGVGDTLAVLSRGELPAEMAAAQARVAAARARLAQLRAGSRPEDVAAARAALAGAESDVLQAERDLARMRALERDQVAAREQLERAESALQRARSARDAAREGLRRIVSGSRAEEVDHAAAEVDAAEAQLTAVRARADELVLLSPAAGLVARRYFEPGEVVGAGRPVVTLIDPGDLWIRVYVGQRALARLRLGQLADVTADALPGRPAPARIVEISPRAEFTPRVALTESEREDLVFAVRLSVHDPSGTLKPGMPARAAFRELP
jgi:HlyD family secretion protein